MATCCSNTLEEKKEEDTSIDHSLKNIVAFSSANMAMSSVNEPEGLFKMGKDNKPIDRRTKIDFVNPKFWARSFLMTCQITSMLPTKVKAVGSGCMISNDTGAEIQWALTCAHNVAVDTGLKEGLQLFNSLFSYQMRQGEKVWSACYSIDEKSIEVHPNHNGMPNSGYDIAICRRTKIVSVQQWWTREKNRKLIGDCAWGWAKPSTLKKGVKIEISGYPGEKDGHPYTHTGEIVAVTKTRFGGHILWHNVDCTKGNSGSPILIGDKDWVKEHFPKTTKVIIAIHTGQCLFEGRNYGTLITKPLYDWIYGKKPTV